MSTSKLTCVGIALVLAACTTDDDQEAVVTGAVSVALTGAGSDGSTYSLPVNTRLSLTESINQMPNYDVSLDGASDVVSFSVAAGNYQAEIYNVDNAYTTNWPLTHALSNGSTTVVDTTLITAQPTDIAVQSGQTTSLVLQFAIAGGGTITFDHGNVAVSVDVGMQPATSYSVAAQASGDVSGSPAFDGPFATQLEAVMPGAGLTGLQISVSANLTGSFQEAGGSIDSDGSSLSVCAPIEIVSSSASGTEGFASAIAESGHGSAPNFLFGPATLCLLDDGSTNQARIRMSREGTAETQTFADIFGSQSVLFWNVLVGTLPTRVYDGQAGTIDLGALVGNQSVPMRLVNRIGSDGSNLWYVGVVTGQMNFSFTGNP